MYCYYYTLTCPYWGLSNLYNSWVPSITLKYSRTPLFTSIIMSLKMFTAHYIDKHWNLQCQHLTREKCRFFPNSSTQINVSLPLKVPMWHISVKVLNKANNVEYQGHLKVKCYMLVKRSWPKQPLTNEKVIRGNKTLTQIVYDARRAQPDGFTNL